MGAIMGPLEIKGIILGMGLLAGALCLYLGYRLYERGVIEKGQLDAAGHGVKITLKDYGPGVVFALFGAAIIVFCVTRTLTSDTTTTTYAAPVAANTPAPVPAPVEESDAVATDAAAAAPTTQDPAEESEAAATAAVEEQQEPAAVVQTTHEAAITKPDNLSTDSGLVATATPAQPAATAASGTTTVTQTRMSGVVVRRPEKR